MVYLISQDINNPPCFKFYHGIPQINKINKIINPIKIVIIKIISKIIIIFKILINKIVKVVQIIIYKN